jgi:hypothetical protein
MSVYSQVLQLLNYLRVPVSSNDENCPYTTVRYNTTTSVTEYFDTALCSWVPMYDCDQPNGVCTYNLGRFRTDDGNNDIVIGRGHIINNIHTAEYFYLNGNIYNGDILWPCVSPTGSRFSSAIQPQHDDTPESVTLDYTQSEYKREPGKFEIAVRAAYTYLHSNFWGILTTSALIWVAMGIGKPAGLVKDLSLMALILLILKAIYFKPKGIQRHYLGVFEAENGDMVYGYVRYEKGRPYYQYYNVNSGKIYKGKITSTFIK